MSIESLGLRSSQWKFLLNPDDYVRASKAVKLSLVSESTRRQFKTARDILDRLSGKNPLKGVLLADDVGLGKTTVAALVAWVVASAGQLRNVRILAPNDAMKRRWEAELLKHVEPLRQCAEHLGVLREVDRKRVKGGHVERLSPGSIQVVKHSYVQTDDPLKCDLLIVDEAHRAKGESSEFSRELKRRIKQASRVLILTATPFSIEITELTRMLKLVGADETAFRAVKAFRRALDRLNFGRMGDAHSEAKHLTESANDVVNALSRFVIRHSVDDLKGEQKCFGEFENWPIKVKEAEADEVEVMLRMVRSLRLEKRNGSESSSKITNDPRFHVGWRHFDAEGARLSKDHQNLESSASKVISDNVKQIKKLRTKVAHPKMKAVDSAVMETVEQHEKVVLFCHHHATAQELTTHLHAVLPRVAAPKSPESPVWKDAWNAVLKTPEPDHDNHRKERLKTFIEWLCSDLIRAQVGAWIGEETTSLPQLVRALERTNARHRKNPITIADAARQLYRTMLDNRSSLSVLMRASEDQRPDLLPGANGTSRVLGVCEPSENKTEWPLFMHSRQPDLVLEIFNSPFGPDVLVVTDRLSEGIDLHRYCRHLIHYELDPSPIRTVQRNGRVRRVNSWAAITGKPIRYAYPAFAGTRDQRLVSIVKKRLDNFSLLLGGVPDFDVDKVTESDEQWRSDVINEAKKLRLKSVTSGKLVAKGPRDAD